MYIFIVLAVGDFSSMCSVARTNGWRLNLVDSPKPYSLQNLLETSDNPNDNARCCEPHVYGAINVRALLRHSSVVSSQTAEIESANRRNPQHSPSPYRSWLRSASDPWIGERDYKLRGNAPLDRRCLVGETAIVVVCRR